MFMPDKSVQMILNEDAWPLWPKLPLIRKVNGKEELGVLVPSKRDGSFVVYLGNVYLTVRDDTPMIKYPSVEELVADGWAVN